MSHDMFNRHRVAIENYFQKFGVRFELNHDPISPNLFMDAHFYILDSFTCHGRN